MKNKSQYLVSDVEYPWLSELFLGGSQAWNHNSDLGKTLKAFLMGETAYMTVPESCLEWEAIRGVCSFLAWLFGTDQGLSVPIIT